MIKFPFEAAKMIDLLTGELIANCELVKDVICGASWELTEVARESIQILLSLKCVDGSHSVSSIAHAVRNLDYELCDSVDLT